jgi:hypothetical protein
MSSCSSCLQAKAPLECIYCKSSLCKDCVQFVDENSYPFFALFEKKITFGNQCPTCFEKNSSDWVSEYNEIYEKAKNIDVFYRRISGKETRLMKRIEPALQVDQCADEKEVLLKLAFCAVQKQATSVIDIEVFSKKFKDGSYTTVVWHGTGIAANRK